MRSGRPPVVRPRGRAAPRFPVVTLLNRPRMLQLRTESAADYWPTHSTSHLNTVGMSSSSTAGCLTEATTTAAATTLLSGNLHSRRPTASQKTSLNAVHRPFKGWQVSTSGAQPVGGGEKNAKKALKCFQCCLLSFYISSGPVLILRLLR